MTEVFVSVTFEGERKEFVIATKNEITAEELKDHLSEFIGHRPERKKR